MSIERVKIYWAAPLFTQAEQAFNASISQDLEEQGYSVFLPQRECAGVEGEQIYQTCLKGLSSSQVVVAILDGADADSGTCWECGYAVSQGIPVIAVRTDFRGSGDTKGFNAMLYYGATQVIDQPQSLLAEVLQAVSAIESLIR
jgi:nucleoside 2-deoxyribosyltransferase